MTPANKTFNSQELEFIIIYRYDVYGGDEFQAELIGGRFRQEYFIWYYYLDYTLVKLLALVWRVASSASRLAAFTPTASPAEEGSLAGSSRPTVRLSDGTVGS